MNLEQKFLELSVRDLHDLYYQAPASSDDYYYFNWQIRDQLGIENAIQHSAQEWTVPLALCKRFSELVIKYGNILYDHCQAGGRWSDFATVGELLRGT